MGKIAVVGAVSGAISLGIGGAVSSLSGIVKIAAEAAMHGISGGLINVASGGEFGSGFFSGMVSSIVASSLTELGTVKVGDKYIPKNEFGRTYLKATMIAAGGLTGGLSAAIAGGNFWDGMRQGLITAGLNHAYHMVFEPGGGYTQQQSDDEDGGGGDPPKKAQGGSLFGDILTGTEKHFNGGLGTISGAVQGYKNIPNNIKRAYAYKLSKLTGVKSGQLFQGAKRFVNSTGKFASKLSPYGTTLSGGVIVYEVTSGSWDAHTVVNSGLMIASGVATIFGSPIVLTGIALYGVGDYFFDINGMIDKSVGRYSGIWKP